MLLLPFWDLYFLVHWVFFTSTVPSYIYIYMILIHYLPSFLHHPLSHHIQWISPEGGAGTRCLSRERQRRRRCLEASGVFFWLQLQPDSSVSFKVKTKTLGVHASQLQHISCLLSLVLQARFTFSWVCRLACSSGNLSPTPPPDLDLRSNKTCRVVVLDK